jgi:hypothetical protein
MIQRYRYRYRSRRSYGARARLALATAVAVVALAGCVAIPVTGPVQEGDGEVPESNPILPFAEGPQTGDSPAAIVSGFLTASAAGFASDFSVAREYLTPEASGNWNPLAHVVVFDSGALTPEWDEATGDIQYSIPVAAEVDENGVLVEAPDGTRKPLTFRVLEDADGEYRISELEDGAVIAQANFDHLFLPVPLAFSSMDGTTIVPDLRWLPENNGATWAARELIEGPAPWLGRAVQTGFPAGSALEVDSVVVNDGVASVQLTAESAGTPTQRSLVQEQLRQTLTKLPGVVDIKVTVGGVALGGDGTVELAPAPLPDGNADAILADRLGVWDGSDLWMTSPELGVVPSSTSDIARSYDGGTTAFVLGHSAIATTTVLGAGAGSLVPFADDVEPPTGAMDYTTMYSGVRVVGPSFDRQGWVWSAEQTNDGSLIAVPPDGEASSIEARWLDGRTIQSVNVSRDGTRVVVLSREGGKQLAEVAAVVRTEDGVPLTLGSPLSVGVDITTAIDAQWIDDLHFAILGEAQEEVPSSLWIAAVGGETLLESATVGAKSVTARHGESSLTTIGGDGSVRTRVGTGWEEVLTGVSDLAYSG